MPAVHTKHHLNRQVVAQQKNQHRFYHHQLWLFKDGSSSYAINMIRSTLHIIISCVLYPHYVHIYSLHAWDWNPKNGKIMCNCTSNGTSSLNLPQYMINSRVKLFKIYTCIQVHIIVYTVCVCVCVCVCTCICVHVGGEWGMGWAM